MFKKLLIANRGEIAVRIMGTARRLGIKAVAVYSDADGQAMHTALADEAFRVGPAPANQSYLDQQAIIAVAIRCGAEAIHPGYGFLAENPGFAGKVRAAGLVFVGPPAAAIRAMGLKDEAKRVMELAGVPLLPGYHGEDQDGGHLLGEAQRIGFPLLIKPVAGGGGKGMRLVENMGDFDQQLATARREASSSFGDDRVLLEKFLRKARHIEIQIMADGHGNVLHLYERDCSLQRRHQKVIEETPAPGMTPEMRAAMCQAAVAAARQVQYEGAGTVEFIADVSEGLHAERFYFMEMNTRLQVEHPVTEMVTGLDLVELQLRVANGEALPIAQQDVTITGHAIEARLYAEEPARDFQPQTGLISHLVFPDVAGLRTDLGVRAGDRITPFYDPMIGKLIVHKADRSAAIVALADVLAHGKISGCRTNLGFLSGLTRLPEFVDGDVSTGLIGDRIGALTAGAEPPLEAAAVALLFSCGYLIEPRSHSPFDTLTGFRLWGGEAQAIMLERPSSKRGYTLERRGKHFIASSEGRATEFVLLGFDAESLRIDCGDRILHIPYFHHDGVIDLVLGGVRHEFGFAGEVAADSESEGGQLVVSPVPGLVARVTVKTGDKVRRGDAVAIVEAMKMEFQLRSERDGVVLRVLVTEGNQIAEGTAIAEIGDDNG